MKLIARTVAMTFVMTLVVLELKQVAVLFVVAKSICAPKNMSKIKSKDESESKVANKAIYKLILKMTSILELKLTFKST